MQKHIMEPIMNYDRLCVLRHDRKDFEILLKAKDLKVLSKERRLEMLQQRMHVMTADADLDSLVLEIDMDPMFERHSAIASIHNECGIDGGPKEASAGSGNDSEQAAGQNQNDENEMGEDQDMEDQSPDADQVGAAEVEGDANATPEQESPEKRPQNKKRRKKRGFTTNTRRHSSHQLRKSYSTCLPSSFRDCTWIDNTEANIVLLREKNSRIQEEREKRKEEKLLRLEKEKEE